MLVQYHLDCGEHSFHLKNNNIKHILYIYLKYLHIFNSNSLVI